MWLGTGLRRKATTITLVPVANPGFDSDTDWTKQDGWGISGGTANKTVSADAANLFQNCGLPIGKTVEVTYDVVFLASGTVHCIVGSTDGTYRTAPGTYTERLVVAGSGVLYFYATASTVCSIDNVRVRVIN